MDSAVKTKIRTTVLILLMLSSSLIGYVSAKLWQGSQSIFISSKNPVSQLASLIDGNKLEGESEGQVNVLLLGIGGEGHDGPYLSDTIIVASIKPQTREVSMVSIPRDTIVSLPGYSGKYKINHAYALPTAKKGYKQGLDDARKVVSDFTGLKIPYAVVVDFEGFKEAVDNLDGIDVNVAKTFTDSTYPNSRYGYLAPVTFKAGLEHMSGERALIYARSRHSTSDFDRAQRQQLIIEAFTNRVKELNLIKNIGTVNKLFSDFTNHVWTNLDPGQARRLGEFATQAPKEQIYTSVLDPNSGITCSFSSTANGYYLDICPGKKTSDVYDYIQTAFARGHIPSESPSVDIYNGTTQSGLGLTASEHLKTIGFTTSAKTSAVAIKPQTTMVYDMTGGKKPNSLAVLLATLSGELGQNPPVSPTSTMADFIVVVGRSYIPPNLGTTNLNPKPVTPPTETNCPTTTTGTQGTGSTTGKTTTGSSTTGTTTNCPTTTTSDKTPKTETEKTDGTTSSEAPTGGNTTGASGTSTIIKTTEKDSEI